MDISKIKAVFFDIDGTYFDHKTNRVLPETEEAVRILQKNGYKVALCSGRPLAMAQQLIPLEDTPWDGFIGGGGISVYNETMEMIWENSFHDDLLHRLFTIAKNHKIPVLAIGENSFLTQELDEEHKRILDKFHLTIPDHIHDWQGEHIHVFSMLEGPTFDYSMFDGIEGIRLQPSCDEIVDIVKTDTNKAIAIQEMMAYWGLQNEKYIAFGDSLNDREMLQEAAIGIAMGDSMEDLLDYADLQCGPSHTPAIYDTLKELGFLEERIS